jgi:hypothetical protein
VIDWASGADTCGRALSVAGRAAAFPTARLPAGAWLANAFLARFGTDKLISQTAGRVTVAACGHAPAQPPAVASISTSRPGRPHANVSRFALIFSRFETTGQP